MRESVHKMRVYITLDRLCTVEGSLSIPRDLYHGGESAANQGILEDDCSFVMNLHIGGQSVAWREFVQ